MNYVERLLSTKRDYPFERWQQSFQHGLTQHTPENVARARSILDQLIASLISHGENAREPQKVEQFKIAVLALNDLNDELEGSLIETGEREELCGLFDAIGSAAGIDTKNYGDGEGLCSEWRDW